MNARAAKRTRILGPQLWISQHFAFRLKRKDVFRPAKLNIDPSWRGRYEKIATGKAEAKDESSYSQLEGPTDLKCRRVR